MGYGVLFSVLASAFFSVGNLLEKRAVNSMPVISARRLGHMLRQLCSSRTWISGFIFGVAAVILTVLAYSLAPIVVVQTIIGAGLALLVLGSHLYLHESIRPREYVGLGLIVTAVTLVSVTLTSSAIRDVPHPAFDVLVVSAVTVIVAGVAFATSQRRTRVDASLPFGLTSGLFYGIAALQAKAAALLLERHGLIHGAARVMASPYPYAFVIASVAGLLIFQSGLQRSRIGVVGPIASTVASLYVVVIGMLVFHEALPQDTVHALLRVLGFALALVGSWFFATGPVLIPNHPGTDEPRRNSGS
jgi:drug/metabolite transporter (DMT)-like permease